MVQDRLAAPFPARIAGSGEPGEYEFNAIEQTTIQELSGAMRFVGYVFVIVGVLGLLGGLMSLASGRPEVGTLVLGVTCLLQGVWTIRSANAFRSVVTTEGSDITHLIEALDNLRKLALMMGVLTALQVLGAMANWALPARTSPTSRPVPTQEAPL